MSLGSSSLLHRPGHPLEMAKSSDQWKGKGIEQADIVNRKEITDTCYNEPDRKAGDLTGILRQDDRRVSEVVMEPAAEKQNVVPSSDNYGSHPSRSPKKELYRHLEEHEIRILDILPGAEETIQCRLIYTNLHKPAEYNTLSYTWGDPLKPRVMITIDGHSLEVTENCAAALYELRREAMANSKRQIIWIDAICINQDNLKERSHQVMLMREIYRNCHKLIIWLGSESDGSADAVRTLKEVANAKEEGTLQQWQKHFIIEPNYFDRWTHLAYFYSRPWFTRVWVVQEYVICARKSPSFQEINALEFYCGRDRISAQSIHIAGDAQDVLLVPAKRYLDNRQKDVVRTMSGLLLRGFESLSYFLALTHPDIHLSTYADPSQFFNFVMVNLRRDSTNPRDRIYAHLYLGLPVDARKTMHERHTQEIPQEATQMTVADNISEASDSPLGGQVEEQHMMNDNLQFPKLIVDYEATVEDVYSSLVRLLISSSKRLDILSLCFRRSSNVRRTWTFDLTEISRFINSDGYHGWSSLGLLGTRFADKLGEPGYRASKTRTANAPFNSNPSVLLVAGFQFSNAILVVEERMRWDLETYRGRIEALVVLTAGALKVDRKEALRIVWNIQVATTLFPKKVAPRAFESWASWLDSARIHNAGDVNNNCDTLPEWDDLVGHQIPDRTLFFAESGSSKFIGKGWNTMKKGDIVCIIFGCDVPLVLRRVENHFVLIGDCYVEGIMKGEAMKLLEAGKVKEETFNLH